VFKKTYTREELVAARGDLSPFLIHLTKDIGQVSGGVYKTVTARSNLESMITSKSLIAKDSHSYFKYCYPKNVQTAWLNSVCLTETPLKVIKIQLLPMANRRVHFESYGLAFFESAVRAQGGNPVIYIDSSHIPNIAALKNLALSPNCHQFKEFFHLFQTFGMSFGSGPRRDIDFRWEREWRVQGNLQIDHGADVAFGLCPEEEITYFEGLVYKASGAVVPFIDPRNYQAASAKLKAVPKLKGFAF
jgi:hypothetical protein